MPTAFDHCKPSKVDWDWTVQYLARKKPYQASIEGLASTQSRRMAPGDTPPNDEDNDNRVVYHPRTPSPIESLPSMSSDEASLFEDSEGDETVEDRVPSNERAYEQGANYEDVGYDYITGPRDRRYRERPPYTGPRDSRSPPPPPRREPPRSPRDPNYEANRHTYSPQPPSSSDEDERPRTPSRPAVKAKNQLSPGQISMLKADRLRHGKGPHPLFSAPPPLRRDDDDDTESSTQHPQAGPSDIWQGRHPNPRPAEWERQADSPPNRHSPRHRRTWGFANVNRDAAPSSSPPHRRPPYRSPSPSRRPEHRRYSPTPERSPPDRMRSRRSNGRYENHEATDSEEEGERNRGRREYSSSRGRGKVERECYF